MGTLTVWKFDTADGADKATGILKDMAAQRLLTIHDAATVRWEDGKKKPQTKQLNNLAGAGALGGAFWGMLFGLIFFVPLLGRHSACNALAAIAVGKKMNIAEDAIVESLANAAPVDIPSTDAAPPSSVAGPICSRSLPLRPSLAGSRPRRALNA